MGREINNYHFYQKDFKSFSARLRAETELLETWFNESLFTDDEPVAGLELEAWLVDADGSAAASNSEFLNKINDPLLVPELAKFNVEINSPARKLEGSALSLIRHDLESIVARCHSTAAEMGLQLMLCGILPSLREDQLCLSSMSERQRYRALNEQVLRLRQGQPLNVKISGREQINLSHQDVMLEAAATSLQIHLQVKESLAIRYYNASKILAAPMTAACANSPFLFGKDLWDETRIPLFEQAVAVRDEFSYHSAENYKTESGNDTPENISQRKSTSVPGRKSRVTFGSGYAENSLYNCFLENLEEYGVLLPIVLESPSDHMTHLRLHNGTIWRWNRPLIGFGENSGEPHIRIEHRVAAAGPTLADIVANIALFYGVVHHLATKDEPPETMLSFNHARKNFYEAARHGLKGQLIWFNDRLINTRELLLTELLPMAHQGLESLRLDNQDINYYLGIIAERLKTGQNGSAWQRAFVARHGKDMNNLTRAYLAHQIEGAPVHSWDGI